MNKALQKMNPDQIPVCKVITQYRDADNWKIYIDQPLLLPDYYYTQPDRYDQTAQRELVEYIMDVFIEKIGFDTPFIAEELNLTNIAPLDDDCLIEVHSIVLGNIPANQKDLITKTTGSFLSHIHLYEALQTRKARTNATKEIRYAI